VDNLYKTLLSTVLRQNPNNTTSPTNAFNLNSTAVQAYLTQKLKGILPNASGSITENELMTAWLLANSGGGGGGTVTSIATTSPILGGTITTAGTISIQKATTAQDGYLSSTDWNTFNGKQSALNGTGFVKIAGTAISYDNTTYYPLPTGTTSQYVRGDGSLATFPTIPSGTVTSVGLALPSIFTVTNSPVTSSGTLTGTFNSQTANTVFAAPNGSSGTPTFRALVAADIPTFIRLNDNDTLNFYDYCGTAPTGSATSSAVWRIARIEWATTTPVTKYATGAWTLRASLIYT